MIWLTWRQFRTPAWVAATALAAAAILLAVTGLHLAHLYDTSGIGTCHGHGDCGQLASNFLTQVAASNLYHTIYLLGIAGLYVAPAIIGIFWGAPLVTREIENGTLRLAWNQSVTRTRWIAVKLSLVGLLAMATGGLLSLMVTWSDSPIDRAAAMATGPGPALLSRITPVLFGARGIAPIGYAAFAFALGVTAGVLIRRTVPAMAATLAVFITVQIAWPMLVRPHLIAPVRSITAFDAGSIIGLSMQNGGQMTVLTAVSKPGAWVLTNQVVDAAGHPFTGPAPQACTTNSFPVCADALARLHLRQVVTYEPASRYWPLQGYETGIFVALALVLAAFCYWRIRRRLS